MKRLIVPVIVALIMILHVFMRFPMLDNIFCDPDVAGTAYSARELLDHGTLYSNSVETKPPGAYMLFASAFKLFGRDMKYVYAISIVTYVGMILCLFLLARSMLGSLAGVFTAWYYAMYSVSDGVNGWCPNFETWSLLPVAAAFYILWRHRKNPRLFLPFLAGACLGLATVFKQTVVTFVPAALPLLIIDRGENSSKKSFFIDALILSAGVALPIALTTAWIWSIGEFDAMMAALNPASVAGYMSSEGIDYAVLALGENGSYFVTKNFSIFLLIFAWIVSMWRNKRRDELDETEFEALCFTALWLVGAFAAFVVGTKFFRHYFVLLIPPLALVAGMAARHFVLMLRPYRTRLVFLVIALVLAGRFDAEMELSIAAKSFKDRQIYGHEHWGDENENSRYRTASFAKFSDWSLLMAEVGRCIAKKTDANDPIYVWDYEPGIYWYADRRAPTKHFMYFNVATSLPEGAGRWHQDVDEIVKRHRIDLIRDFSKNPPAYIISLSGAEKKDWWDFDKRKAPMFEELSAFQTDNYTLDAECSNYYIDAYARSGF